MKRDSITSLSMFLALFMACYSIGDANDTEKVDDYHSTYLEKQFTSKIDKNKVKLIVELGAYHGFDAVLLHLYYKCPVYTFECDTYCFDKIKKNIAPYPHVVLVPYGVWDETKKMIFYHTQFPGASSFFKFDLESIAQRNELSVSAVVEQQKLYMTPFEVDAVRLDEWIKEMDIESIDLLCIDVQGASLNVLKGLGSHINNVKYIITEVEYSPIYEGEALFPEIKKYLEERGFLCFYEASGLFSDVLFINKSCLT